MAKRHMEPNRFKSRGVGLVEILVALLVLAIGVLGYAGLQLSAIKKAEDANSKALAALIAQDALERIMLNPEQYNQYATAASWPSASIAPGGAPPANCVNAACSANALRQFDINSIRWLAGNSLPDGRAGMMPCGQMACMVVSWDQVVPAACVQGGAVDQDREGCIVLEVRR